MRTPITDHPDLERLQGRRGRRDLGQGSRPVRRGLDRPDDCGSSQKLQVSGSDVVANADQSRNPRERVILVEPSQANPHVPTDPDICYRIRVKARTGVSSPPATRSGSSSPPPEETRTSRAGSLGPEDAVTFVDASYARGRLYPPADQRRRPDCRRRLGPSSSVGPTLDGRVKPDVDRRRLAGLFQRRPDDLRLLERRRLPRRSRRRPRKPPSPACSRPTSFNSPESVPR